MRSILRRLVSEPVVLSVIALNLVVLFVRGHPSHRGARDWLFYLDLACLGFFVFEMGTKITLDGWRDFWARALNRFDLAVVALSTPAALLAFTDAQDLTFLMALRGTRVLRLFRVLRVVPDAERIWGGILRALRASFGVGLAFGIYNILLAIFAAHLFGDVAPAWFGTPGESLYTVFKAFTLEGWYEIPDAIAASGGDPAMATFIRMFFIGAVVSGGMVGLGLVNAVFVDEMVADNHHDLEVQLTQLSAQVEALRAENAETHRRLDALLDRAD